MIEISFGKLVLLALVALIVLGPEKLPGAARTAGALLRRVRNGWDSVRAEVERELEVEEIRRAAREAAARAEAAQAEFKDGVQQVRQPVDEAAATLKSAAMPAPAAAESVPEVQPELPLGEPPAAPATKEAAHGGH
ncbi:MAG TPA: Sec-independent protein translocase protein TatB [Rhodanobacter sp.]